MEIARAREHLQRSRSGAHARQSGPHRLGGDDDEPFEGAIKPAKVALTAAMRKLLTILNAILRSQTPWQAA